MSIWGQLLFLHGYRTHLAANEDVETRPAPPPPRPVDPERLRAILGCWSGGRREDPPFRTVLGVRGLA